MLRLRIRVQNWSSGHHRECDLDPSLPVRMQEEQRLLVLQLPLGYQNLRANKLQPEQGADVKRGFRNGSVLTPRSIADVRQPIRRISLT